MGALLEIFDPKAAPRPIGIDLGTTHSLVAYVSNEMPTVIEDCGKDALVPSVVAYEGASVSVGAPAKRRASEHPKTTIASVKRFMGRGADDPETERLAPYEFIKPAPGEPNVVRFRVGDRAVTPVEVSAEILRELKRRAEGELGQVGPAVITVPAYFDDGQRQATKDAGRLAGLEVLRLLNEPTAAALAYGLDKKVNGHFAVYDLGGGTFDVTVLLLEDGVFQVKATGGDSALGGDDMDRLLAEWLLEKAGWGGGRERVDPVLVRLALDGARDVKHVLSTAETAGATLPSASGSDVALTVTREVFESLIEPLLVRTGVACRRALQDAGVAAGELDGVILVGGATRSPSVRDYVGKLFGRQALSDIDPDKVVVLGAAVQADLLAGASPRDDVLLLDVLPLSLGIEVGGGVVDKILPRNTTIPVAAKAAYTTQEDRQTGFELHVVQGERELAADCRSLAHFTLKGIPPMAAGMAKLEVRFGVDADGLLTVVAKELTTGKEQSVEVKPSYGLSDDVVERMLIEALDHGEDDLVARRIATAKSEAHRVISGTRKALKGDPELLVAGEGESIDRAMIDLERCTGEGDPVRIGLAIEELDRVTRPFAVRRMNRAIALAVAGKGVDDVALELAARSPAASH